MTTSPHNDVAVFGYIF